MQVDAEPEIDRLLQRFSTGRYRPATFLERGVTLPVTTPQLLGARLRPAERKGMEVILPHLAGAEGVYILPWPALFDFCAPSLHDRALWEKVNALPVLSPGAVREAARKIAAAGHAGRSAARAAATAASTRRDARALAELALLLLLIRQGEPASTGLPPPERDLPANIRLRARAVLKHRSGRMTSSRALEALEEMGAAFEGTGLGPGLPEPPLVRLAGELGTMATEIAAWSERRPPEARGCADLIVAATRLSLRCAQQAIAKVHSLPGDMWELLRRWDADAEEVRKLAAGPDWLLDGWDLILGLWRTASEGGAKAGVLDEMALLIPVLPNEARDWLGFDAREEMERHRAGMRHRRRTVQANQDWMTGRMAVRPAERGEALREVASA